MASKKSTPKLKKKVKNKGNDLEESEAREVSSANEPVTRVSDESTRRDEASSLASHCTHADKGPDLSLPKLPEKPKEVEKKKSKFWNFMTKKKMLLPKCSEVKEEQDEDEEVENNKPQCTGHNVAGILYRASLHSNGATASPVPTAASQARRLSMGAAAGPTGLSNTLSPIRLQLLQLVPPAAPTLRDLPDLGQGASTSDDANDTMLCQQMRATDMGVVISSNPIGYPHLCFSRSMSNSSSGSSSSSGASSVTDHSVTHGLVSTIYPQIDVIVPTARFHGALPPLSTNTSTFSPRLSSAEHAVDVSLQAAAGTSTGAGSSHTVHTQVDYMHYLVPDLLQLTNCSFYWGVMDRYEAERLLENRPEGTFLVRDSAQEEFLFSVSFRRYGRSLHARIEQWNHRFSFDSHDLGVFASNTVCGLIEHYKDPNCCMFFEPMLTLPLSRTFCFSLQHLCRAVICSCVTYDSINELQLPKCLHEYLKYYHYKQRICVRRFETH